MEFNIKIDKLVSKKILIGLAVGIVIILSFFLIQGSPSGEKAAVKEVKEQIKYELEDEYSKDSVSSIRFRDMKAEETTYGENYYKVFGYVDYKLTWLNTDRIDDESLYFVYYIQHKDGEWSVQESPVGGPRFINE